MPTIKEINAVFDVIKPKLQQMVQDKVPFFFRSQVASVLESPEATHAIVEMAREGLEAAEKVRSE